MMMIDSLAVLCFSNAKMVSRLFHSIHPRPQNSFGTLLCVIYIFFFFYTGHVKLAVVIKVTMII